MNLDFKTEAIFKNYTTHKMHPKLAEFLWWWCGEFYEAMMTSAWRPTGIHSTGRAVDLRTWIYSNPDGMEKYANSLWEYDPKRPGKYNVVYRHGPPDHYHIQVHDRTVKNGRGP
jgi:hypothetical protein